MSDTPLPLTTACCICALLPDDGTDRHLLRSLFEEQSIVRANSVAVRSVGVLQTAQTRSDRLPEGELAKLVTVIVDGTAADTLFDYVCEQSNINRPGGGLVTLQRLTGATAFTLPTDVPHEGK